MTELEFISTNPTSFGNGNTNLLISSSVSGSEDTPIAPFTIQGMTVPFNSKAGTDVVSALKETEVLKFEFQGTIVESRIIARQKKSGYYYFRLTPVVVNQLPPLNIESDYEFVDSEFIFKPYFETDFFNNDFNPLANTTNVSKTNAVVQVVDRISSQILPTNLQAILSSSAEPAQIQNCSYTKAGIINARYNGSKETDRGVPGNDPAVGLATFKASLHPTDSDNTTVKNIQLSDREVINVLFDTQLSGSHPNKIFQSFPTSGSFVFFDVDGRLTKVADQKVYAIDKDQVYTLNEFGGVTVVA